ncbi:NUMOD4 domain-containing protein [Sphingorhabdus sp.]|uniref:NUMOD4 domain-containing protein n=1 Tax=Sphingorhabdus sp. TaxID=1902408 RepID=UPI00334172BD
MERVEMETWRDVSGYEGAYEVSDLGNVRSVTRWVSYGRHKGMTYKGRPLKLTQIKNGYLTIKFAFAGRTRTTYVHETVLKAFEGPRPHTEARGEIRHLDGVKTNNALSNLNYGTINENAADRVRHKANSN